MSIAEAEEKFKELIKLVSVAEVRKLREAYENLKRFAEGEEYRLSLVNKIKDAVKQSVAQAVENRTLSVEEALDIVDSVATLCMLYYGSVVTYGWVDFLSKFIGEVIETLKKNRHYYEWMEELWIDMQEVLKEMLGG
jgi:predicted HAD superfamily Cof-like phosphohydrolase